jgi:secretion/DNA translocation related TadE-like protein
VVSVRRERGGASVLVVAAAGAVVAVLAGSLAVVATVRDVHRARAAADLAALAAAAGTAGGGSVDCASANAVAGRNGSILAACGSLADGSAVVTVSVPVLRSGPASAWLPREVTARARAGVVPPDADPG